VKKQVIAPVRPRPRTAWRVAAIVLVGAIVYANSLSNPFILDDDETVVENQSIRAVSRLAVLFPQREVPTAGRPLVNASIAINYALGGLNERGYHVFNLILHLLCGLLLMGCVRRTLESPRMPRAVNAHAPDLAFAAALIWILHPLNSEVVDYVTQRTESMMALFYLLTIYASARNWPVVAVLSCAAGMACKESMVTAPVMVWLHDRVVLGHPRRRWPMYAGLAATWGVLAAVTWSGPRVYTAGFGTAIDPWSYLLNQAVMIPRYLKLAVWPHALVLAYGAPDPLALSDVLPQAIFVVVLVAGTVVALFRWPLVGFAGAWFFITLAPTSSVVPIATEVGAERRMYLPLAALVTLAVLSVWMLWQRYAPPRFARMVALPLAAVAVWFGAATVNRNREYASRLAMAQTVLARWPTPFAHAMVGSELATIGRRDEAIAELRLAAPTLPVAGFKLGAELYNQRRLDEAIAEFRDFLRREPLRREAVQARTLMGRAFVLQRRWPEAIEQFQLVLDTDAHVEATGLIGDALFGQEKFAEAVPQYRAYLAARPGDAAASINLARALFNDGDLDGAAVEANRLVRLQIAEATGHNLLGWIFATRGQLPEARAEFARAVQLDPGDEEYRRDLDQVTQELSGRRR
jgi:protein O-mannosyl-transferase